MNYKENDTNKVILIGKIVSPFEYRMELEGICFYKMTLQVKRYSDYSDLVLLLVPAELIDLSKNYVGQTVYVTGQFRSYNSHEKDKIRVVLYTFVNGWHLLDADEDRNVNEICLQGFLCKPPIYRKTPLGKEIADLLLAVNRKDGQADYIPCITWKQNARFASRLKVGNQVRIKGRIQSREYDKKEADGVTQKRAYEVSISKLDLIS